MTAAGAANIGTAPVREAYRFDQAALERWMAQHVEGFSGPLTVEQFKGGQSNPTYKLTTPSRTMCSAAVRPVSSSRVRTP